MFQTGKGVAQDHAEAVRWYRKAADQGLAEAQFALGFGYANGQGGLAKDDVQAAFWYRKAADQGEAMAQNALCLMYDEGHGVPQNYALATYWYRRSAEQGNPTAQHLLGLMFDKGLGTPTNHVAAHTWLSLAASRTKGTDHEDNVRLRDAVAAKMSFGQLYDAQALAQTWLPKPEVVLVAPRF